MCSYFERKYVSTYTAFLQEYHLLINSPLNYRLIFYTPLINNWVFCFYKESFCKLFCVSNLFPCSFFFCRILKKNQLPSRIVFRCREVLDNTVSIIKNSNALSACLIDKDRMVGYSFFCFVHPIFGFWFLVTFGDQVTKVQKYLFTFCKARWAIRKKPERESCN